MKKEDVEVLDKLIESGKFTVEEIAKISGIEIDEAQTAYEKARKAAARRAADRNAARRRGEMGGRMERETYTNEAGKEMHYKGYSA
jgi:predicted transcriptional regulator